jgi:cytochrome c-type biogenesis protein
VTFAAGLGDTFARTVTDGPLLVAALVAALVGLISFLSPCVLPLVPGYLSYVTGLAAADAADPPGTPPPGTAPPGTAPPGTAPPGTAPPGTAPPGTAPPGTALAAGTALATDTVASGVAVAVRARPRVSRTLLGATLFVLGFTAVFVSFGTFFGTLGARLVQHQDAVERVLGAVVVVLGLAFLGVLPGLQREVRVHRLPATGLVGAPLLGVVFGLGWTPCIGPTLGAVQTLAYSTASAGRGALLSAAYCLGLGVPFLLAASGFRWLVGVLGAVRRHAVWVTYVGGGLLVVLGLLLLTGAWAHLMNELRSWAGNTGLGTSL